MSLPLLRFLSYREYLETDHWRETRAAAIARAGGKCALCPRVAEGSETSRLHVHHRTYERLGEELPADLVVLCAWCHEAYELGREQLQGVPEKVHFSQLSELETRP